MRGIEQLHMHTEFYCGALAGLTAKAREKAQIANKPNRSSRLLSYDVQGSSIGENRAFRFIPKEYSRPLFCRAGSSPMAFTSSDITLEECLHRSTCAALKNTLTSISIRFQSGLRKAELVALVLKELPQSVDCLRTWLCQIDGTMLALFGEAMVRGTSSVPCSYNPLKEPFSSSFPYLFWSKDDSGKTVYMPPELRKMLSLEDFETIACRRREELTVERLLFNALLSCGTLSMQNAFTYYNNAAGKNQLQDDEFSFVVKRLCYNSQFFHFNESSQALFCRPCILANESSWGPYTRRDIYNNGRPCSSATELEKSHEQLALRLFTDCMPTEDFGTFIYSLPSVLALTAYFDEHVPINKSEYLFADAMVDRLLGMMLFDGATLSDILRYLTKRGWFLAEGSNRAPLLTQLVCEVYRTIPRWELNGWSEREYEDIVNTPELISKDVFYETTDLLAS